MHEKPLVSFVIPCFRAHDCLSRALQSLVSQTYKHVEVLVVSDDETDYTHITSSFSTGMEIRHFSTGGTGTGWVNAKNTALPHIRGAVLSQLDADDFLQEDYLARLIPRVIKDGACVTPRQPVLFQSNIPIMTWGLKHRYAQYAPLDHLQLADFIKIPFNWQTLYRTDLIKKQWPDYFEDDLYFECHLFEQIGHVPFEPYFGYGYSIRNGSICHNEDAPAMVIKSYQEVIHCLTGDQDFMGLSPETRRILATELHRRIQNINRYLHDKSRNALMYKPDVLIDIIHYPQGTSG